MKKFLGTLVLLLLVTFVHAQVVKGVVTDNQHNRLASATVTLKGGATEKKTTTSASGEFQFTALTANETYTLLVEYVGMKTYRQQLTTAESTNLDIVLTPSEFLLEPLEVKAVRASEKAPFTKTDISKKQLEQMNLGQDLPFMLNQVPSVTITSDAGNGVGYTGIRVRGSDATRINVTLNGIPYNDAESQGTYFVDLPDFTSSVNSIQVQRGVGTSTNGAGAFGATINMSTNEFHEQAYAESNNSFGSFNTWKNNIKVGSGFINDHFTFDARLSRISSDGYIDRAASSLQSFYF